MKHFTILINQYMYCLVPFTNSTLLGPPVPEQQTTMYIPLMVHIHSLSTQ